MPYLNFLLIMLSVMLYGAVHSALASLKVKAIAEQIFGQSIRRYYRLLYNILGIVTLLPVIGLTLILPDHFIYQIPMPWRLVTITLQMTSLFLLVIGISQTGISHFLGFTQLSEPVKGDYDSRLVVSGLYRWTRHPLYSFGLVFIWLTPLMTRNILGFNIGVTLYIIIGTLIEERKLVSAYGDAYTKYQSKTPMLIPGLKFKLKR